MFPTGFRKFHQLEESIQDALELAEIAIEEDDASALEEIANEMKANEAVLHEMEFIRMFSNKITSISNKS